MKTNIKKKALLVLTLASTFILASCGKATTKATPTTKKVTTKTVTTLKTTTSNNQTLAKKDRGSVDNSIPDKDFPNVKVETDNPNPNPYNPEDNKQTLEVTEETFSLGDEDYVETNAGTGESVIVSGERFLSATVNVGYNFEGWFIGDTLLSKDLNYKCNDGEIGVVAKYSLKDEFKYFEFESTENECTITGLKENYPKDLIIPEGVTRIASKAFIGSNIAFATLPESLEYLEDNAFQGSRVVRITIQKFPNYMGEEIAYNSNLGELFIPDESISAYALCEIFGVYSLNFRFEGDASDYYVIGDFLFKYDEGDYALICYLGDSKDVVLPDGNDTIKEYYIGGNVFYESDIESVKFSNACISIGNNAFYNCDNLTKLVIDGGVTYIGQYAFEYCDNLTELVLGDNVKIIDDEAFQYDNALTVVTLGKNVETINYDAFYGCGSLNLVYNYSTKLTLTYGESSNVRLAEHATVLTSRIEDDPNTMIKDGFIYEIDEDDEDYVTLLSYIGDDKDIVIPTFGEKFITLGENLFSNNNKIETVTLNEYCIEIEDYAFYQCSNLKSVNTGVATYIDYEAFYYCSELEEVIMPNVDYISSEAFYCCYKLKTVTGSKITYIGSQAFYNCYWLEAINLEKVTQIYSETFKNCYTLKEAVMNEATAIGASAFYECRKLEKAIMPKATSIGNYAFYDCYKLRDIDISSLQSIGKNSYIFYNDYSLITLTIPSSLTSIDSYAYAFTNCSNLTELINYSNIDLRPNTGGWGDLCNSVKNIITDPTTEESILTVENNLITYINSDNEKVMVGVSDRSVKKVVIPSDIDIIWVNSLYGCDELEDLEVKQLPEYTGYLGYYFGAYYGVSNSSYANSHNDEYVPHTLKTLRLGEGVTSLSRYELYGCNFIENLYIGKNVTSIGYNAFYDCKFKNIYYDGTIGDWCNINFSDIEYNPLYHGGTIYFKDGDTYKELDVIEVPEGITTIGNCAFYECHKLKEVVIKDGLTSIGEYAFSKSLLKGITLPNSLLTISSRAFEKCSNLISVKLGNSVTTIGDYAFSECRLLYNFNVPASLANLGNGVFANCETLEELSLENTAVTVLNEYLFYNCVNLETFGFPAGLTSIETTTFENCEKIVLTTYKNGCYFGTETNPYRWLIKARAKTIVDCTVHPDCEKIFDGVFSNCKNLKKIIIPATCVDCGSCLFGLTNVEYIETPYTSTQSFGMGLFGISNSNLTKLKTIIINGGAIADDAFTGLSDDINLTITGDITAIGANALKGRKLTSFIAPASLKTIGNYAFQNCTLLEEVDLNTVESIGKGAFKGCIVLSNLTLSTSNKFTIIPESAFEDCISLTTVQFEIYLTEIGDYAFKNSGLATITKTTNYATYFSEVKKLGKESFMGCKFTNIRYFSSTITNIGANAFKNCLELTTVTDYSIKFVGTSMFEGCTALTKFSSTSNTATLNNSAFKGCSSLTNLTLRQVSYIGELALSGTGITEFKQGVQFDESATNLYRILKIKSSAFYNCKSLTTVYLYSNSIVFEFTESYSTYTATGVFSGCSNLVNVTLPSNMTTINANTFKDCTSLVSFNFSNITKIGQNSFQNTGLISVEIPETVTSLSAGAFMDCENLEIAILNCSIPYDIFKNCTSLREVIFNKAFTIAESAFENCTSLESIVIPEGSTKICKYAFRNSGLKEVVIPSSMTNIMAEAFRNCKLESIVIPGTVTSLGTYIFADNENLKSVVVEEGITTIPNNTFAECHSLESVELPASITSISSYAFYYCTSLSSILLPKGLTSIGSCAFQACDSLKTIYNYSNLVLEAKSMNNGYVAYNAENIYTLFAFASEEDIIYYDESAYSFAIIDGKYYLISYNYDESTITLPTTFTDEKNNVEVTEYRIYANAFFGKTSITKVIIPASVKEIGEYAFAGCSNLAEIYNYSDIELTKGSKENGYVAYYATTITTPYNDPENIVTDANGFVFAYVDNKGYLVGYTGTSAYVVLPDSFTFNETEVTEYEIYKNAFYGNVTILSVTIPSSVTAIGENAFKDCYKLLEVYNLADSSLLTQGYVSNYAFETHSSLLEDSIFITDENGFVFALYETDKAVLVGYTGTATEVTIPTSFTYNEQEISDIVISDYAFVNSIITKITIPASIYAIGNYAFMDSALKEVVFEDATNRGIGKEIFKNCKIEKATISADMIKYVNYYNANNNALKELVITSGSQIEANALRELPLKSVTLSDTITSIGAYAFYKCADLKEIDLPSGLLSLGECAFNGCSNIVSIVIPNTLSTISYRSFYNCSRLLFIYIPNPEVVVESQAFYKTTSDDRVKVLCNGSESDFISFDIDLFNNGELYATKCFYRATAPSSNADKEVYWHYDANGKPITYRYEELKGYFDSLITELKSELLKAKNGENSSNISTDSSNYNSKIIQTGDNYTITIKAYFQFCYKGYGTPAYEIYWGITSNYSSSLVIGLNDDGYYVQDESAVTIIYGYDFYCEL